MFSIVIVEDSEIDRSLLETISNRIPDVVVKAFANAVDALDYFADVDRTPIDLVLCDYEMPRMSGLTLLQKVRPLHPNTPFVFVSAHTHRDVVRACKARGADGYIAKPYRSETVFEKIRKYIQRDYLTVANFDE